MSAPAIPGEAKGAKSMRMLRELGGFSDDELSGYEARRRKALSQYGGFSQEEVDAYFGVRKVTDDGIREYVREGLEASEHDPGKDLSFLELARIGTQSGVGFDLPFDFADFGLTGRKRLPDKIIGENYSIAERIAAGLGTLASDLPTMLAGFAIGGGHPRGRRRSAGCDALRRCGGSVHQRTDG